MATTTALPDGSTVTVDTFDPGMSIISRRVDGEVVWGQVFACSISLDPDAHRRQVAEVVDDMRANPDEFRRWWKDA